MSSLKAVFFRELRQMFARPGYPFVAVLGMAFCCLFFLTVMDEGLPQRLPVGIVDHDGSSIARMLKREVDAGQSVRVVAEYASYTDARQAMQRGEIYAFLVIPENFYGDLLSYKRPTLTLYANSAYTLGGTLTYRQLTTMANLVSAAVQREVLRSRGYRDDQIMALIQPIVLDTHAIGNPWVNYSVYLSSTLLPGLLGMIVLMLSAFSMTHELKMRTSPDWLQAAGGHVPTAVLGKMLPYTILFTVLGWAMNVLMYKVLHFPLAGSFLFLCLATAAYVVAMQAVAVIVVSWLPTPGLAVSLCALYSTLSLTLSGFSYPVEAMLPPFQALTWLVPLRHYYLITVDQTLLGLPVAKSCLRLAILLAAVLLPLPLSGRLKKAMSDPEFIGD